MHLTALVALTAFVAAAASGGAQSTSRIGHLPRTFGVELSAGGSTSSRDDYDAGNGGRNRLGAGMVGVRWSNGDPGGVRLLAMYVAGSEDSRTTYSAYGTEQHATSRWMALAATVHGDWRLWGDLVVDPNAGLGFIPFATATESNRQRGPSVPQDGASSSTSQSGDAFLSMVGVALRYRGVFVEQQLLFPVGGDSRLFRLRYHPLMLGYRF